MSVLSKIKLKTIDTHCNEYVHPWSNSCSNAWAELFILAFYGGLRINCTAYLVALLMRGKTPSKKDIKHTILGIIQSSFFLSSHAVGFAITVCFMRKLIGNYNVLTVSFVPSFLSNFISILIERPSRRGLLSLYVTNVASETFFRMMVWRGWVKPIKYGEVVMFTTAISFLLYCYRSQLNSQDGVFALLRFFVGPCEEQGYIKKEIEESSDCFELSDKTSQYNKSFKDMIKRSYIGSLIIRIIKSVKLKYSHPSCPHNFSCIYYSVQGFLKLFSVGYGLQMSLKLLFNIKKLLRHPAKIPKVILNVDTLRLGAFFGGFAGIYRLVSCTLRTAFDKDSNYFAIPASYIAGLSFCFFKDNTVALYMVWKALQLIYVIGNGKGIFPKFPHASIFFHCLSTAVLFHAALLEPHNLRPSYWNFLATMSGGRAADMDRKCLDAFGLESSKSLEYVLNKRKNSPIPKFNRITPAH